MLDLKGMDLKEVITTGFTVVGSLFIVVLLILFGWILIWKMFLVRFSFIRELVYGNDEINSSKKTTPENQTLLRRSSRLRERQSKNQHGEI